MKTVILGLDAFDPEVFERLYEQGRMPNLGRYVKTGGYARFSVSNPAQSEVSWTSIATGANPGNHGLFDFVHRDPATYALSVSLLPTRRGIGGTQFVPPYNTRTLFEQATRLGYPATALWWPATFPARVESPVHSLPGLGVPDIQGRLGVGALFTTDIGLKNERLKTPIERLELRGKRRYLGQLKGPRRKKGAGSQEALAEFYLEVKDSRTARLSIGKNNIELERGKWSPIFEVSFKLGPLMQVWSITRAIWTHDQPDPRLYFLPLQIHPLRSPWRYATPQSFVKQTWNSAGPFLTLGWPQDTTGLEEGWINDEQFLDLCDSIFQTREKILHHHLEHFKEGVLASVFDSLDRVQHMFWRDDPQVIEAWYIKLDQMIGRIEPVLHRRGNGDARLLIVSDHGFSNFDYKVHLNRWLVDCGYLTTGGRSKVGNLQAVDWSQSQAYAVGLNSIYLNLADREGQGCVQAGQKEALRSRLREDLLTWRGPDGSPVLRQVWFQEQAFSGSLSEYGPDLVVGFAPGYRASAQTGLGAWEESNLERNRDHWGADHCIDPEVVPGVLFSNHGLENYPAPSYRDFPVLSIGEKLEHGDSAPPPKSQSSEDQSVVEERLKSLGYL